MAKVSTYPLLNVPALTDKIVVEEVGTPSVGVSTNAHVGGLIAHSAPQLRLTAESGVPVSSSDRSTQGTLYATPSTPSGDALATGFLRTYDGTRIRLQETAEVSKVFSSSLTSGKNYDVFIKNSDLSLVLSTAWTSDTLRADALTTMRDLIVASADNTYLWLGTIRAVGTDLIEDSQGGSLSQSGGKRFIWNAYNQVPRVISVIDTSDSWSYTTDTIRQANGASGNKVEYVTGSVIALVRVVVNGIIYCASNAARAAKVGVGVDSTTSFSGRSQGGLNADTTNGMYAPITGTYEGFPGLGYHYLSWNEKGADGTSTFLGDNGGDGQQAGLGAAVFG